MKKPPRSLIEGPPPRDPILELEDALFKTHAATTDLAFELGLLCRLKAADPIDDLGRNARKMLAAVQEVARRLTVLSRASETITMTLLKAHAKANGKLLMELIGRPRKRAKRKAREGADGRARR